MRNHSKCYTYTSVNIDKSLQIRRKYQLVLVGGGGDGEMVKEGEYSANTVYTCM
jgi:hypothetical protein